jgi:cytochrome P450
MSAIAGSVLAMVMYPKAQRHAQAQLDAVIGRGRLPDQSDRTSLPYLEGFCREAVRWHSVGPLGVMRTVTEDDWYAGRFIPRGGFLHCDFRSSMLNLLSGTMVTWNNWYVLSFKQFL